jgi:hypothetical protein
MRRPRLTLLVAAALLGVGVDVARADKCTALKLRAMGAREAGLLRCRARLAATGDSSRLAACEAAVVAGFDDAFAKAGPCAGAQGRCVAIADACAMHVAALLTDAFPSRCESGKRKAAGALARKSLGCHAKAAKKARALKSGCLDKARNRLAAAFRKAGTCPDGGAPADAVEDACVEPAVSVGANGFAEAACPGPASTTSTTVLAGGTTSSSLTTGSSATTSSSVTTSTAATTSTSSTATSATATTASTTTTSTSTTSTTFPGTFTLSAVASGFYREDGTHAAGNYAVGWFTPDDVELRDYFVFDLSPVSGTITAAFLRLATAPPSFIRYGGDDPSETFTLFDVSTALPGLTGGTGGIAAFADLGGGTSYGSLVATSAIGETVDVVLNAAGIAFLAGSSGQIAIGGAITTLTRAPNDNEFLFNATSAGLTRQLVVTTE